MTDTDTNNTDSTSNGVTPGLPVLPQGWPKPLDRPFETVTEPEPKAEPKPKPQPSTVAAKRKRRHTPGMSTRLQDRLLAGESLSKEDLPEALWKSLGNAVGALRNRGIHVLSVEEGAQRRRRYSVPGAPDDELLRLAGLPVAEQDEVKKKARRERDAANKRRQREKANVSKKRTPPSKQQPVIEEEPELPVFSPGDLMLGDNLRVVSMVLTDSNTRQITLQVTSGYSTDVARQIVFETDEPQEHA